MRRIIEGEVEKPNQNWIPERLSKVRNTYDGPFNWSPQKVLAARLLASGEFSKREVADAINVHQQTIYYWLTFTKFYGFVEKLVLETGLAGEAQRLDRIKKRVSQINRMINKRIAPILETDEPTLAENFIPLGTLLNSEQKLLEMISKREQGADTTLKIITGGLNPDEKRVNLLQDIVSELPADVAETFKNTLLEKAQKLIMEKQKEEV